ncbi:MAG: hypothetical protein IKI51_00795 [Clostridia bacterium]|nr:hypothetical protein [Clostridia bacterium]
MNIDKSSMEYIMSMSDAEFSDKISKITSRLGVNANVSPDRVRMMLRSMSESDIEKLILSLGEARAAQIMKIIKGGS